MPGSIPRNAEVTCDVKGNLATKTTQEHHDALMTGDWVARYSRLVLKRRRNLLRRARTNKNLKEQRNEISKPFTGRVPCARFCEFDRSRPEHNF
jgi:hypothetical protein